MALRDLFIRFRVDVAGQDKLSQVDRALGNTKRKALDLGRALNFRTLLGGTLIAGGVALVKNIIDQANALKTNAERLGISTDEMQKYEYVSGIMGIQTEQTAVAIRYFNRTIGEYALGTKSAVKITNQLGLQIRDSHGDIKPTDELLFEFADKLKGVKTEAERTAIAMRFLGRGGSALLPMLQNGSTELRQMFKDVEDLGGGLTHDFTEKAREAKIEFARLRLALMSVASSAIGPLIKVLKTWADRGIALAKVLKTLSDRTYAFAHAVQFLTGVAAGYSAIKAIMAIVADPIAALTIGAIVAGLLALYLVFDDLSTWAQGGKSVFGDMMDSIAGKGTSQMVLKDLSEAWAVLSAALKDVGTVFLDVGKSWVEGLGGAIPAMVDLAMDVIPLMIVGVTGLAQALILLAGGLSAVTGGGFKAIDRAGDNAMRLGHDALVSIDAIKNAQAKYEATLTGNRTPSGGFSNGAVTPEQRARGATGNPADAFAGLPPPPAPGATGRASDPYAGLPPPPRQVAITNNITIHGNADPKAVANAAKNGTKDGLGAGGRNTYDAATSGMPMSVN